MTVMRFAAFIEDVCGFYMKKAIVLFLSGEKRFPTPGLNTFTKGNKEIIKLLKTSVNREQCYDAGLNTYKHFFRSFPTKLKSYQARFCCPYFRC